MAVQGPVTWFEARGTYLYLGPLWWILIKCCWEELGGCHFDSCVCIYLCPLYYMDRWALVPLSEIHVHIFCATLHTWIVHTFGTIIEVT
jgi:hypothetical protein